MDYRVLQFQSFVDVVSEVITAKSFPNVSHDPNTPRQKTNSMDPIDPFFSKFLAVSLDQV
jgi:hypothetical protein